MYTFPYVHSAEALIKLVRARLNYAVFDRPYSHIEFVYANGHVETVKAGKPTTKARTALDFLSNDNETLLQGKPRESGHEFRMRDLIEPNGGVTVLVHLR